MRRRSRLVVSAALAWSAACGGSAPDAHLAPSAHAAPAAAPAEPSAGAKVQPASPAGPVYGAWPFSPPPAQEDAAGQLTRLERDPGPIKSNWVPPGKRDRYGHAEALIGAPYDAVRSRLVDYVHFKDLAGPRFHTVKVVDKQDHATDVYFVLPIMKGLVRIWYVTRFAPPRAAQGGEVFEGSFVKGNIKDMHIVFALRKKDEGSSVLTCDLLLSLSIPAPQSNVDEELRDACGDALNNVRRTLAN